MARSRRELPSSLGPMLREVRARQDKSLRDLERATGLTNGYLSQVERNEVGHPSPTVLRKLAQGYEVPFPVLLQWAGFIDDEELALSPNQAVALSTIGDPSTEELEALKGIIAFLNKKGSASYSPQSLDLELDEVERNEIARYARALLLEADAFGSRPTPLEDLTAAAALVRAGEITLTPQDRAGLAKRIGRRVDLGWKHLLGTLDFRSDTIWIKPGLPANRERFVLSHEIGHAILPAHRETFAYIENRASLSPDVRVFYEREANQAAVELLFQCGQLAEEADSSALTLKRIGGYAEDFGASIVATARNAAETSKRDVAVAIAYQPNDYLGPTHLYTSDSFEARFRWQAGRFPGDDIRQKLRGATSMGDLEDRILLDIHDRATHIRIETVHTGWAAIALIVRESAFRQRARRAVASP